MMHCWIELDSAALRSNYRSIKEFASPTDMVAVIKSNAYGHGLEEVWRILRDEKPTWLGVAYLHEAAYLRQNGFAGRLLVVTPVLEEEFATAVQHDAEILVTHHEHLKAWLGAAQKPKIHLKFDTGLSRQGFSYDDAESVCAAVKAQQGLVVGVCTHFANVEDVLEHEYADLQLSRFAQVRAVFKKHGLKVIEHAASSASTLILPDSTLNLCRVGIALYGQWPSHTTRLSFLQVHKKLLNLKPVLTWKTKIYIVKKIKVGAFIGYGCTFRANRDMTIAILPVGYSEGYPRLAGNDKSYVLIHGQRCPLVGRLSMNLMAVDISHLAHPKEGDEVVLLGHQGSEHVSAETLAAWAQTIDYELLTRLNPEIPRRIV